MNNENLYRRQLMRFLESQSGFAEGFSQAVQAADFTTAQRYAHTLRGVAGNIGARDVQHRAADLERACAERTSGQVSTDEEIDQHLREVVAALAPVLTGLEQLKAHESAPALTAGPIAALNTAPMDALRKLRALLADSDSAALDVLDDLPHQWTRTPAADGLRAVRRAVDAFDFDDAVEHLDSLMAQLA